MNTKSTLVVVAIALVLGAYVFFFERGKVGEPGQAGVLPKVLGYNENGVWKLQIEAKDGTVWLARDRGSTSRAWKLEKPISAMADADQVGEMVRQLNETVVDQVIKKPADLKAFGLDNPSFEVRIATEDGGKRTLLVGGRTPGGDSIYLKPKDRDEVFVATAYGVEGLQNKKADDLRDKSIMSFTRDDVQKMALAAKGQTIVIERSGKDTWQITAPSKAKAKAAKVDSILMSYESLKGSKVVADNPTDLKQYGLDAPQATVSFWVKGEKEPRVALLGSKDASGEVYAKAKHNPAVFTIYSYSNALSDAQSSLADLKEEPAKPANSTTPPPPGAVKPELTPATPEPAKPAAAPAKPAPAPARPAAKPTKPVRKPIAAPAKPVAKPAPAPAKPVAAPAKTEEPGHEGHGH